MFKLLVLVSLLGKCVISIKVCSHFADYNLEESENCWNTPIDKLNVTQIIKRWDFQTEEHSIITQDGYILLLVRCFKNVTKNNPVIIGHGIGMSSLGFVIREKDSLPYVLGKLGYDVWLINFRGTKYSQKHTNMTKNENKYWDFSFHEMGVYDLPSILDRVHEKTGQKSIYIGYSMANTALFIYSSLRPQKAKEKISGAICLAPSGYWLRTDSKIIKILANIKSLGSAMTNAAAFTDFIPYGPVTDILKSSFDIVLRKREFPSPFFYLAEGFLGSIFGSDYRQMDPVSYPVFVVQALDLFSFKTMEHYGQLILSKKFNWFDYGKKENFERYNRANPPEYPMEKIEIPFCFFVGNNDLLVNKINAKKTYSVLNGNSQCGFHVINHRDWSHLDFITARDVSKLLYSDVINDIKNIEEGKCHKK